MFSNQLFFAFAFVFSCLELQLGVYALPAAVSTTNGPTRFPPPSVQISAFLDAHNAIRRQHNAADLEWSPYLARMAGFWTDQCQFKHTNGVLSNEPYGENVAAGTGDFPIDAAVATFVSDRGEYNPTNPSYLRFTQVVWKSTTEIGCAVSQCDNIFDPSLGKATLYVCLYNPPGNVIGRAPENVQV